MDTSRLDAFIFDKMSATRLPGLSIALVRDGEVVYARGFGQANIEQNRAATPQTLYGAASITKSFIAIAILQLAERGPIRLGECVRGFQPLAEEPLARRVAWARRPCHEHATSG